MKVLIVDDERLARERLVRMVGTLDDYEVVGDADSGQQAILKAIELEPDIVLLDIRMPGMDGLCAGKELATLSSPPAVVFCTAFGEHAIDAFDVQASGYLLKPIKREILRETLSRVGNVNKVQRAKFNGKLAYHEPEAAALIGITSHALRDARLRGEVQASRAGARIVYEKTELLNFLERNRI